MKTLLIKYFRYTFWKWGWTGTEHYTCMIMTDPACTVTKNLLRSACWIRVNPNKSWLQASVTIISNLLSPWLLLSPVIRRLWYSMFVKIINFPVFLRSIILPANWSLSNFCLKPQIQCRFLHELLYKGNQVDKHLL